jgi:hypothetical protein
VCVCGVYIILRKGEARASGGVGGLGVFVALVNRESGTPAVLRVYPRLCTLCLITALLDW